MKISIDVFDVRSIDRAIKQLEDYSKGLNEKAKRLCERLADMGAWYAEWNFSNVAWTYSGTVDYAITVDRISDSQYIVKAGGEGVLFLEFGAGITLGYGPPLDELLGMGPGTYPNAKGHWDDPNGWWYKDEDGTKHKTFGNAPGMPMYNAAQDLRKEILKVAREVFQS